MSSMFRRACLLQDVREVRVPQKRLEFAETRSIIRKGMGGEAPGFLLQQKPSMARDRLRFFIRDTAGRASLIPIVARPVPVCAKGVAFVRRLRTMSAEVDAEERAGRTADLMVGENRDP